MCSAAFCQLPRRPVDVGAQPQRLAALEAGDHLEREIVAADIGQRARLDHQPRHADLVGEVGGAGGPQHGLRLVRLAVHQIDHGEPRRHLRARGALQAVVDLVLQQLGGLVEQIDRNQPLGEPADHLVAAPADRGELAEIVEQAERVDRRQRVALAGEEQRVEGLGRLVLDAARQRRVTDSARQRHAHDVERVAVAVFLGVKPRQHLQRLDLGLVAAPGGGEHLQLADDVGLLGLAERIAQRDLAQPPLRRRRPVVRGGGETIGRERVLRAADAFGHAPGQHRHRGLDARPTAPMVLKSFSRFAGVGEIADLDRGAQRVLQRHPLQFERQARRARPRRRGRRRAPPPICPGGQAPARATAARRSGCRPRGLARSFCAASTRPSMMLATARSTSGAGSSAVGRSSAMAVSSTALASAYICAREIEPRQIEPRRGAAGERRFGGGANQIELPLGVIGVAIEAPAPGCRR